MEEISFDEEPSELDVPKRKMEEISFDKEPSELDESKCKMEEISFDEEPSELDETVHELKDFNYNYYKNHYNVYIQELRQEEGVGLAMKLVNDRLLVNMVGSRLMDDVLTGRCDDIHFEDFMKRRKRTKRSELVEMRDSLGFY